MKPFLINVLLTIAWVAVAGELTLGSVLTGFVLGYVVLFLTRDLTQSQHYISRVRHAFVLTVIFLWELIRANLRVALDVVTIRPRMRPAIVAVPLDAQSDPAILLLSSMITSTPGNLLLEVSHDRRVIYVYGMYVDDIPAFRRDIKRTFERRIILVFE